MINEPRIESRGYWHKLFEAGVFLKGFNGVWELVSGCALLFVSKATVTGWALALTQRELYEDPKDRISLFVANTLQNLSAPTQTFIALYVLAHGILNIFLAIHLYRDEHWAYPVTIGTMLLVMAYQAYRIYAHHSIVLLLLTLLDALFVGLLWHEYKYHRDVNVVAA